MPSINSATPIQTPLRAAYTLSRKVEAAPGCVRLKEMLYRLTFQKQGDAAGMHTVGYFGRQQHAQLYGYLIVDQEYKRLAEGPMPVQVHPLPDEVRTALRAAHEEICALNRACVHEAIEHFPNWAQAFDPYGLLEPLRSVEDASISSHNILSLEAIRDMSEAFKAHPAFVVLQEVDPLLGKDYVLHEIARLEAELHQWGAMHSPPYIEAFKKRRAPGIPVRRAFRAVEALVCLRASLRVLDQMIFQKLKANKLPCLTDREIFAVPLMSMHDTGRGMDILFQPVEWEHHFEGGELLIVPEIKHHTFPDQRLYQVADASQAMLFSAFSEDGAMGRCQLRPIDENLCPYKEMWSGAHDRMAPESVQ